MRTLLGLSVLATLAACSGATSDEPLAQADTAFVIEAGSVGFDELAWAPGLHRVIVPAGGTGRVHLLDPATGSAEIVDGFSKSTALRGGHSQGPTSAAEAEGYVVTVDRTAKRVVIFDPKTHAIVGGHDLGATPDYVRFDPTSREVWVTEPDAEQIEVFALDPLRGAAAFERITSILIADGPESLVFDTARGRAYASLWRGVTVAIDIATHAVRGGEGDGATTGPLLPPATTEENVAFDGTCSSPCTARLTR